MEILHKKKETLQKGSRAIVTAVCLVFVMVMAAGCGKVEEPIPVQLSSGNVEELQSDAAGENRDDPEEAKPEDDDPDSEDVSDRADQVDTGDDTDVNTENGSKNNAAQKAGQSGSSDENDQQTKDVQPQSAGSAELEGNVQSIGADSFVAARNEVWSEGNASYAVGTAPGYEDEEDLITVYVGQNCVWEFKTVKNGGINSEDVSSREGSFADLKEGIAINSKGSWQNDGSFLADSIVMMIFV